jgi:predicted GIY-YIG superfamily endonuclease
MPVDDCCLTFEKLATDDLPGYMEQLLERMAQAVPLSAFAEKGVGPATLRKRFGYDRDPRGCYVLLDGDQPVYVGISKHVIARLMEHVRGTDHFTATLGYRIAVAGHPHAMTAKAAMHDAGFHPCFEAARKSLLDWRARSSRSTTRSSSTSSRPTLRSSSTPDVTQAAGTLSPRTRVSRLTMWRLVCSRPSA